ncbi:MAG: HAMP domain-containing protein [Chloroflexota bacterium]|nr:HAMP domain-containing protein [Chloroflexota bacterium]
MTTLNVAQPSAASPRRFSVYIGLRWKLLIVILTLFALVFLGIGLALNSFMDSLYNFSTQTAIDNLKRDLESTALATSAGISGDLHTQLYESGQVGDATFLTLNGFLRQMTRTNPKAAGIYTYVTSPEDPAVLEFVVTSALPPGGNMTALDSAIDDLRVCKALQVGAGFREPYTDYGPNMLRGLTQTASSSSLWTDAYGTWLSGFAPIRDVNGNPVGAVGVDMCAQDVLIVQEQIRTAQATLVQSFLPLFAGGIVTIFVVVLIFSVTITRPVHNLTRAAARIADGDYSQDFAGLTTGTFVRDEVVTLAEVFALLQEKVRQREETLKQQVAELQIMIDETKLTSHVAEIVESDFFRELQGKAANMRTRRTTTATGTHPVPSPQPSSGD